MFAKKKFKMLNIAFDASGVNKLGFGIYNLKQSIHAVYILNSTKNMLNSLFKIIYTLLCAKIFLNIITDKCFNLSNTAIIFNGDKTIGKVSFFPLLKLYYSK